MQGKKSRRNELTQNEEGLQEESVSNQFATVSCHHQKCHEVGAIKSFEHLHSEVK